MKVLLFARARELAGQDTLDVALPAGATVAALRQALAAAYPRLASLAARSAIAVNSDYADDAAPISPDAEVALIPPVSGG